MTWSFFDYETFSSLLKWCSLVSYVSFLIVCNAVSLELDCPLNDSTPLAPQAFIRTLSVLLMWKCNKVISRRVEQPPLVIVGLLCYCRPSVTYLPPLFSLSDESSIREVKLRYVCAINMNQKNNQLKLYIKHNEKM